MINSIIIECPFCNHKNTIKSFSNVVCKCGAKLYVMDGIWLNRSNGNEYRLKNKELECLAEFVSSLVL